MSPVFTRRALAVALSLSSLAPVLAVADEQPSTLPGQPGGDPAPDTRDATTALRAGRYDDAITAAKRALQRDERYTPAMIVMAKAYYYQRKFEFATNIIDLVLKLDPKNSEAYMVLGFVALTRSDTPAATASFKKATELKDDYGNAWNTLSAQYLLAKNYDAAVDASEKATKLLPNFDKAWLNLGSAYRGKGQYTEAQKAYEKALQLNPQYANAYFNLGILYLDAPQMPDMDLIAKLNKAIEYLGRYQNMASYRMSKDDPAVTYVEEAKKGIDREQKRLQRLQKQKERDAAKKAPSTAPAPATGSPQ